MDARRVGEAALVGWRARVTDAVARPVARRTPWSEEQLRAAAGVVVLALTVRRLAIMLARLRRV